MISTTKLWFQDRFVSLTLSQGHVVFRIGYGGDSSLEMMTLNRYNTGNWTRLEASRYFDRKKKIEKGNYCYLFGKCNCAHIFNIHALKQTNIIYSSMNLWSIFFSVNEILLWSFGLLWNIRKLLTSNHSWVVKNFYWTCDFRDVSPSTLS